MNKIAVSTGAGSHFLKHTDNNSADRRKVRWEGGREGRRGGRAEVSVIEDTNPLTHLSFPPSLPPSILAWQVTLVYYMNPDWPKGNGGELRLYPRHREGGGRDGGRGRERGWVDVAPEGDTLVMFLSDELAHEVRPNESEEEEKHRWTYTLWLVEAEKEEEGQGEGEG